MSPASRTAEEMLLAAVAHGAVIAWDWMATLGRPGLRAPAAVQRQLAAAPPDVHAGITEILRRAGHFRRLVAQSGSEIPWMILPESPPYRSGLCVSCGARVENGWRCSPCTTALTLALTLASSSLRPIEQRQES